MLRGEATRSCPRARWGIFFFTTGAGTPDTPIGDRRHT
jgi:hypothetical protein